VRLLVSIIAIACVDVRLAAAQPAPEWIVVSAEDPAFRSALVEALAPAGMSVIVVADQPAPSVGELSGASRSLADREHATATVWLTPAAPGATLVTYDRERDRLLVRELPYQLPLSAFQAAEAARTARTMLRALRVTPDVDQPPPLAVDAPAIRDVAPVLRDRPMFAASAMLGVRVHAPDTDLGGSVALIWRPDSLGAALVGEISPSADVPGPAFVGSALDSAVAALARLPIRMPFDGRMRVVPTAGLAVHFIRIRGELDTEQPLHGTRLDPAARVGAAATYRLGGGLDVGVAISLDALFQRQRYVVGTEEVLEIPRFQTLIGAIATFRVL
jgi:hypothetical protein